MRSLNPGLIHGKPGTQPHRLVQLPALVENGVGLFTLGLLPEGLPKPKPRTNEGGDPKIDLLAMLYCWSIAQLHPSNSKIEHIENIVNRLFNF